MGLLVQPSFDYRHLMENVLCNISAFRFHRVPPQVLMLMPVLPAPEFDHDKSLLMRHPLIVGCIGCPVHLLFGDSARAYAGKRVVNHVWRGDRPKGAITGTPLGLDVTDPLFTLLTMAPVVSEYLLVMAMYEFCGTFGVFQPSPLIEALLAQAYAEHLLDPSYGWRRMVDANGNKTNLWRRPPLISLDGLRAYVPQITGMRGAKRFSAAAASITGATASPFEAQASMVLGMGRRRGGWGLDLENNVEIPLSRSARLISGTVRRFADIIVTGPTGEQAAIIECQGQAFHGTAEARIADSDRTTALQSMGHQVIQVTHAQIRDQRKCEIVVRLIERMIGVGHREKTALQKEREERMRREIFVPWESF